MKRKIVQHGSTSLTITLPMKWVKKNRIKRGDEVSAEGEGRTLTITAGSPSATLRKKVEIDEQGIFTKNDVSHLYHLGYDEIEITFNDAQDIKDIRERLPNCIGYDITDQKSHMLLIQSIASQIDIEFDTFLRKSFLITLEMAKGIIESLKNHDELDPFIQMETLNNKFTDVCIRILHKKGHAKEDRIMEIHDVVKNIERVADEVKAIAVLIKEKKAAVSITPLEQCTEFFERFYKLFYTFNGKAKQQMYQDRTRLKKQFSEALEKAKGAESLYYHHCLSIIEKTYDAANAYYAFIL